MTRRGGEGGDLFGSRARLQRGNGKQRGRISPQHCSDGGRPRSSFILGLSIPRAPSLWVHSPELGGGLWVGSDAPPRPGQLLSSFVLVKWQRNHDSVGESVLVSGWLVHLCSVQLRFRSVLVVFFLVHFGFLFL